jgi:hypothetical protein
MCLSREPKILKFLLMCITFLFSLALTLLSALFSGSDLHSNIFIHIHLPPPKASVFIYLGAFLDCI